MSSERVAGLPPQVLADTTRAWRVLETSHPPVYYIHSDDVRSHPPPAVCMLPLPGCASKLAGDVLKCVASAF